MTTHTIDPNRWAGLECCLAALGGTPDFDHVRHGVLQPCRSAVSCAAFDPGTQSVAQLARRFDRAFIALHGRFGEDGTIQGVLEWLRIPYGQRVQASSIAIDSHDQRIWEYENCRRPDGRCLPLPRLEKCRRRLGDALIVKPAREGSTIGISKVLTHDNDELAAAYQEAAKHDDVVRSRTGARTRTHLRDSGRGRGGARVPLIEIRAQGENYDYQNNTYRPTQYCARPQSQPSWRAKSSSLRARLQRGRRFGLGRVDVIDVDARAICPTCSKSYIAGMTSHSLVPMAAKAVGMITRTWCSRSCRTRR